MGTWTTTATIEAPPEEVLGLLTDPEACARWSPIEFDLEELDGRRLEPGSHARVAGVLGGRRLSFDVDVLDVDAARLRLRASGPVDLDVEYRADHLGCCSSEVTAIVSVTPRGGLRGRLLSSATDAVLAAGTLRTAVERLGREAELALAA
jgi:Polyketide cyclase / dehydrase and lipid transport